MDSQKVIISKQNSMFNLLSLEDEIGLSSYDLALISINKIIKNSNSDFNDTRNTNYSI